MAFNLLAVAILYLDLQSTVSHLLIR